MTAHASPTARGRALARLAVFALGVLPFLGALHGEFLNWDDRMALLETEAWRGFGLENLRWMATSFHMGHHMPLTWLSWAVDHAIWGLDPFGFHLGNLLLHGVNAVLVFLLAERLLAATTRMQPRSVRASAALGALFFAVHPLRVESVAWITERRDVLSCAFLLGSVLAYLGAVSLRDSTRSGTPLLLAALTLYVLSLLSKAWGITLPVVLLVLDVLVLRRRAGPRPVPWKRLIGEKLLFVPFALASAWLAALAQQHGQAMLDLERHGLVQRVAQAAYGLCAYPLATLAPLELGPLYALDPLGAVTPLQIAALLAVALGAAVLFRARRRFPAVVGAFAIYAVLVSPVLGLTQSGVQAWADRYSYIACIPFAILVAAGLRGTLDVLWGAGMLVLFGLATFSQTYVWSDSISVWRRVVAVEPASFIGHWMLGVSLQEAGRHADAVEHLELALAQRPDGDPRLDRNNPGVRYRMALSLAELDRPPEAEAALRAVLAQRPDHPPALDAMRRILRERGEFSALQQLFAAALRTDPRQRMAWLGLFDTLLDERRPEDAATVARQALAQLPDDAALHARLGYALLLLERHEPALTNLRRAIELDPALVAPRLHLGDALLATGDRDGARAAWSELLAREPEHEPARQRLERLGP
jgi:tetratricopeptide (TPR) repeat protein